MSGRAALNALVGVARAVLGHLRRQPWQAALSLLGVALGVAVVVAIDVAADSAADAHTAAERAAAGRATHRIVGGPLGVPESLYRTLRVDLAVRGAVPALETTLRTAGGAPLRLVGIDPYVQALRQSLPGLQPATGGSFVALLTRTDGVLLGAGAASRLGAGAGDRLAVDAAAGPARLEVLALLDPPDPLARRFVEDLAVADVATVQELAGRQGWLDAIDLVLDDDASATIARIETRLPPGVLVETRDAPLDQARRLTRAFDTNLDMLGVLALLVGLLLVYNTMTFSIVQRREQLGVLRALGATRRELFVAVLAEAALVGVAASVLGVLCGQLLAEQLLVLVARTLNNLYFQVQVEALSLRPGTLAKGALLGIAGAVLAAAVPALEAARTAPVSAMRRSTGEEGAVRAAPRLALAGAALALTGLGLLALPGRSLEVAFAALFLVVLGAAATTPVLLRVAVAVLTPLARVLGGPLAAYAVQGVAASASRSAVAVAALAVALSTTVGVSIMVDSFRASVDGWLRQTLRADFYVSGAGGGAGSHLPDDVRARLRALDGVAAVSLGRAARVRARDGPLSLLALRLAPTSRDGFALLQGEAQAAWSAFDAGAVLVSEPLAYRRGLRPGAELEVMGASGWLRLPVVGVYRDYGSEQGTVLMEMAHYRARFGDAGVGTAGVFLAPGAVADTVVASVRGALADTAGLRISSSAEIRALSLAVFDRTFAITRVLRSLTVLVAFIGVLSALMALQLERARELALLRATGVTRLQAAATVLVQTGTMGLTAGLLAIPAGVGVGVLLVQVINRRAFGWSMELTVDPGLAVQVLALALAAALLAGVHPAARLALRPPADGLRHE